MFGLAEVSPWTGVAIESHLFAFSPILALTATMLAVVATPLIAGRGARTIAGVATFGIVVALILAIRVLATVDSGGLSGLSTAPAEGMLIADNLAVGFQIVLCVFLLCITYLWWLGSASTERNATEFFILLLGSAVGMALMAGTANLLMIVVAIETASLPSYALVGFDKRDRLGAEASLKYMIFGAVCAAIMLYGASLIYGLSGSLSVSQVAAYTATEMAGGSNALLLGAALLCFFAGIAFKVSAVPFHFWCPDAFEGAKIEVTTWLSVVSKAAGLVLLARVVTLLAGAVGSPYSMHVLAPLAWTLAGIAAVTCTVGNFAAYVQTSVKRLLAYSSIAHAGYMMMAAAVFLHPQSKGYGAGITALVAYIIVYMFMNLGAFGIAALVIWDTGSDRIEAFTGLIRRAPWLAVPMVFCLISLVGLPIFAGFLAKWWVLVALGELGNSLGWFLVIVLALNTLFSLYYYMRIVVRMTLMDDGQPVVRGPLGGIALVNLCGAALVALFVFAGPLRSLADRFSRNLLNPAATSPAQITHRGETSTSELRSVAEIAATHNRSLS
jgi:NADH-quinone oxidoreductase subunit N